MGNLAGWPYWKVVSITGQAGSGTDYQVELEIGDSAGGDFHLEGHCTNFPQDIRITDDDGTTLLDHWVEDLTADPIVVHVEVKDDLGSNRDIRIYYGKSGETTASHIKNTMIFGDDFSGGSVDTVTRWHSYVGAGCSQSQSSGEITFTTISTVGVYRHSAILSQSTFGPDSILEARLKLSDTNVHAGRYPVLGFGPSENAAIASYLKTQTAIDDSVVYSDASSFSNDWRYQFNVNGAVTSVDGQTISTTYKKFSIERYDTNKARWLIDDVQVKAETTTIPESTQIALGIDSATPTGSSFSMIADYIFVRKYNSPEPAFSSAGAEQSPTAGLIKLTVRGETIIVNTLDEWGNRVIDGIITEYGVIVYTESRMFSDSLTVGDTLGSFSISKFIANGVGILDTISRTIVVTKVLDEIASISDVVSKSMSILLTNTISIADTINVLRHRIFSEVISIADTLGSFSITKVILNSFTGFVDTVTRGNVRTLPLEIITTTDIVEKGIVRRSFDDAISIVDAIIVTPIKSCIEAIGVTDALGAFSISKLISNTINIIDSRISSMTKTPIEEVISTNDSISNTPIKVTAEVIVLDDSIIKDTIHIESETISISDSITHLISKVVTEVCDIVDTIGNAVLFIRTFVESITTTDVISSTKKFFYEKRSKVTSKLLQSSVVNKLLRSKVKGIKNSEAEQYED